MTRLQRQGRSAPHSDTCSRISARISRGICCTRSCARRVPAVRFPTLRPARVSASPATDPATAETSRWSAHCCTDSARRTGRAAGVCHRAGRGGPVGGTWHCGARLKRRQRLPWKSERCHATTVAWCARCSCVVAASCRSAGPAAACDPRQSRQSPVRPAYPAPAWLAAICGHQILEGRILPDRIMAPVAGFDAGKPASIRTTS
jgi:hypothetical protein